MRRVRIVFALLALLLLGAAGLLVQRAVAGVAADRAAQRSTLAARIFDEMELALSDFLGAEESVPFARWLAPPQPDPPFVVARFALLPGAGLQLSAGAPPALAELLGGWLERRSAATGERAAKDEASAPVPATTAEAKPVLAAADAAPKREKESLYDALQSLNRGAESRAQRSRKLEGAPPPEAQLPSAAAGNAGLAAAEAPAPAQGIAEPQAPRAEGLAMEQPRLQTLPDAPRVVVDPLLGDRLDPGRLLLARTVLAGDRGYRQGMVLDAEALGRWLRERAVGGALGGAALGFSSAPATATARPAPGEFAHRFAEPFDGLEASLSLPPLPDAGSADTVLRLSLLLVAAGGAGLFALYRMVAVALRYAEQRSNFVAAVSHELKTPLTAIRMYGEMLRDGLVPTEEKRAEYYRTITAESERLSRLIDNVLEFARIERGERPVALRTAGLGAEVRVLVDALRPHVGEAGFSLELVIAEGLPPVAFDRDAVAQILVNLVDNALKYARGAVRRELSVTCAAEGGGVALRIRDHGPGVSPRELGRVFELFHRGESELTRTTRGTGLGLALVRSLAERMGATVSARNVERGGFEVSLLFPPPA
jgi:signal transduction histidine kinase